MADEFIRQTLITSVAQICDNLGWHAISDSSMKILRDILHKYICDLCTMSKKYAEHADRLVPDIDDVEQAFRQKSISLPDLRRYIKQTGPVKFPHSIPPLNIPGKSTLNTLKAGSREIVTRPIHFHEHLPTLYPEQIDEEQPLQNESEEKIVQVVKQEQPDEEIIHKRLREISSVVMTSGGFLSPSREGRLAESKLLPLDDIKIEKSDVPLVSSLSETETPTEPSQKTLPTIKKANKSKKLSATQKKQSSPKIKKVIKKKLNTIKKSKEDKTEKTIVPFIVEPVMSPLSHTNTLGVREEIVCSPVFLKSPDKEVDEPQMKKIKIDNTLPKFSFFGTLPQGPGLIPSTFPLNHEVPETIAINSQEEIEPEAAATSKRELKKKKKEKKKEKKEKKKKKDKSTYKVPKIKLKITKPIETANTSSLNKNISIVSEPQPVEDMEQEPDDFVDVVNVITPKVPNNKNKVEVETKTIQPKTLTPDKSLPPFYYDEAGNQVWICPMCTKRDDGSPMIGCDGCDVWYHWVCVGIQCPPDCAIWYCPKCLVKRAQQPSKSKRGRPRKNKH